MTSNLRAISNRVSKLHLFLVVFRAQKSWQYFSPEKFQKFNVGVFFKNIFYMQNYFTWKVTVFLPF